MADKNEFDEEYQFSELDEPSQVSDKSLSEPLDASLKGSNKAQATDVRRNALIVIAVVVLMMVLYKFVGAFMSNKRLADSDKPLQSQTVSIDSSTAIPNNPEPVIQTATIETPPSPQTNTTEVAQQVAALQMAQQSLRQDMNALNNQLSAVNGQLSDLSTKIAQLTTIVGNVSSTVELQVQKIQALTPKPKIVKKFVGPRPVMMTYSIQAVIPGRAWLIAQNGSTITVREGTTIPGYGIVKLVDPIQGQVLTSSGRIIKFSQSDS